MLSRSLSLFGLLLLASTVAVHAQTEADRQGVYQAAMDYVNALYDVKPELIERSVHPNLQKVGFWRANANQDYRFAPMTYDQLHSLAGRWNAKGDQANAESQKEVVVLDVLDQTASVKLIAVWGIDYMQLGKVEGQWKILNIVWQSHPMADQ